MIRVHGYTEITFTVWGHCASTFGFEHLLPHSEEQYSNLVALERVHLPPTSTLLFDHWIEWSNLLTWMNRLSEAKSQRRQLVLALRDSFGRENSRTITTRVQWVELLIESGQFSDAILQHQEISVISPDVGKQITHQSFWFDMLMDSGRFDDAFSLSTRLYHTELQRICQEHSIPDENLREVLNQSKNLQLAGLLSLSLWLQVCRSLDGAGRFQEADIQWKLLIQAHVYRREHHNWIDAETVIMWCDLIHLSRYEIVISYLGKVVLAAHFENCGPA